MHKVDGVLDADGALLRGKGALAGEWGMGWARAISAEKGTPG